MRLTRACSRLAGYIPAPAGTPGTHGPSPRQTFPWGLAMTDHALQIDDVDDDTQIAQVLAALTADLGTLADSTDLEHLAVVAYKRVADGRGCARFCPSLLSERRGTSCTSSLRLARPASRRVRHDPHPHGPRSRPRRGSVARLGRRHRSSHAAQERNALCVPRARVDNCQLSTLRALCSLLTRKGATSQRLWDNESGR